MSRSTPPAPRHHRLIAPLLGPGDAERPRITAAILATPDTGTCVLTAPPGFGATTAVAQALSGRDGVAWVSLDGFDATTDHLVAQLGASLAAVDPVLGPADRAEPSPDHDLLGMMAPLVERVGRSGASWIVLDGVDADVHAGLLPAVSYLLDNIPPGTRVALTTHDALELIPAAASDRRLVVIDADQLIATDDEAAQIVLATAPDLDVDVIEDITAAAQGWVAAIRLAARHALAHPTEPMGHWLLTRGALVLLGPWIEALPADRLELLEATAFLERLSAPLCDAVLQTDQSLMRLIDLEAHGSYLVAVPGPRPDASRWWSRHPLLTAAIDQRRTAESHPDLDLRAAAWFEAQGDLDSTMRHLLAAGQLDLAADVLKGNESALFEQGRGDRVSAWYTALPPDSWGQAGWHLLRVGWGQAMSSESAAGAATLAQLRAHLATSRADGAEQRVLAAEVESLSAYLASHAGDTTTASTSARRAIDQFSEGSGENSQQIAPIVLIRALLWEGDEEAARRELARIRYQPFPTGVLRETAIGALRAQLLIDEGRITQAHRQVDGALRWLADHGLDALEATQIGVLAAQGALTLESGDAVGAVARLEPVVEAAMARGNHGEGAHALLWLARARLCLGQPAAALSDVHRARRALQASAPGSGILHRIDLDEAFIRLFSGDTIRAERLLQRAPASDARTLLWARATLHRQSSSIRRALAAADNDTPRRSADKQLLLAMIALRRSTALAEAHLLRAGDIAEAHGLRTSLLGYPGPLLAQATAVAQRTSHDHLAGMVEAITPGGATAAADAADRPPYSVAAGPPLSRGELELIAFLPRRDTNAEIAGALGVSVNTVKTRLYRLYRKLGVTSRGDAIEVVRARGLIE